jgi:hypothetical protein
MMRTLMNRAMQLALVQRSRALDRIADELRASFGEATVELSGSGVAVSGHGLTRRWRREPALRFLGAVK